MKKLILGVCALCMAVFSAKAIPAYPGVVKYTQPDGTVIELRLHGDEHCHWATTLQGEVMALDEDGFYRPSTLARATQERSWNISRRNAAPAKRGEGNVITGGTHHIPVILVSFDDKDFTVDDPKTKYENLLNQKEYSYNGAQGSVNDYYQENSHSVFNPVFDVFGPVKLSGKMAEYGNDENKTYKAVIEGAKLLDDQMDFSQYDSDNDGYVDMILMYYAGYNEAEGAPSSTIWPHSFHIMGRGGQFDGVSLDRYFCTSELKGTSGKVFCSIGTTCHEFAHSLGLPDFYDANYDVDGYAGGLYYFSLMCYGAYTNNSNTPPYLTAIERNMLGWMLDQDIKEMKSGTLEIPSVQNDVAYRFDTDVEGEFFLLETRDGTGWDKYLPSGLLIYHVDQAPSHAIKMTIQGFSYTIPANILWEEWETYNAINNNGSHPCCYLVPSADQGNLNYTGSMSNIVFPGAGGYKEFTPVSWDKHDLGIYLFDISYSQGVSTVTMVKDSDEPDYAWIDCEETYSVGSKLSLSLVAPSEDQPSSVSWTLDGAAVSGSVQLNQTGTHYLEATLNYSDGRRKVIEARIEVN